MFSYPHFLIIHSIHRALVSGNYFKPSGVGYGGQEHTSSVAQLINFLQTHEVFKRPKEMIMIDVHTGLGPTGVDTLSTTPEKYPYAQSVFFTEYQAERFILFSFFAVFL